MDYVISTPDRHKDTQVIHVNWLKPYLTADIALDSERPSCCTVVLSPSKPVSLENAKNSEILGNLPSYLEYLPSDHATDVTNLIISYQNVFGDHPKRGTVAGYDVKLFPGTVPLRQNPYRFHPQKRKLMKKEVDYLLRHGLAAPIQSSWASPCLLAPKEDGQLPLCTNYRRVNAVTVPEAYPLPRVDDLIDEVGQSKFIKIDLLKGYYQIPLTEEAQRISAFTTPFGLFQFLVIPFGMRNGPATFQQTMNYLLQDIQGVSIFKRYFNYLSSSSICNKSSTSCRSCGRPSLR